MECESRDRIAAAGGGLKSDIAKFVPKDRARIQREKALAPLTGASFSCEKGVKLLEFDLLKSVDLKRDGSH